MESVKPQIEEGVSTAARMGKFQATQVISQVVAGTIYYIKILISDDTCLHVKIFKPLPYTKQPPQLMAVKECRADDPLVPFS